LVGNSHDITRHKTQNNYLKVLRSSTTYYIVPTSSTVHVVVVVVVTVLGSRYGATQLGISWEITPKCFTTTVIAAISTASLIKQRKRSYLVVVE
jgi:ABC-type polysaccharide/polyol phosphate export permease